jgi:hypothetical protein
MSVEERRTGGGSVESMSVEERRTGVGRFERRRTGREIKEMEERRGRGCLCS